MILVTGATGFLGSHLVSALVEKGEKVLALRRADSVIPSILLPFASSIEWRTADMLNLYDLEQAFENADKVYHCAAMVSFDLRDRKRMIRVNSEGTANVVELCLRLNVQKLLHVSSVAAIGEAREGQLATEETVWEFSNNSTGYGISKFEAEREVWRAIVEGLNAVIVNPSIILGESDLSKGSGRMFGLVKSGFGYYTPGLSGMISVQDVVFSMIALMDSTISGERFILSAENVSYKDFFQLVARHLSTPIPVKEIRPWVLKLAGRLGFLVKNLGLNKESAAMALDRSFYDASKFNKLGFRKFTPVNEIIEEICGEINLASIPVYK